MGKLITASLIDQAEFAMGAPPNWKDRAYAGLSRTVKRIWEEMDENHPIKLGMKFEDSIQKDVISKRDLSNTSPEYRRVIDKCHGGLFQQKIGKNHVVDGVEYYLSGKIDVYFPKEKIIDIKTTGKYKPGKYLDKFQHLMYCFIEEVYNFEYVVVQWEKHPKIKDVHSEYFTPKGQNMKDYIQDKVDEKIRKTMKFIYDDPDLWKNYEDKFCYGRG